MPSSHSDGNRVVSFHGHNSRLHESLSSVCFVKRTGSSLEIKAEVAILTSKTSSSLSLIIHTTKRLWISEEQEIASDDYE